MSSLPPLTEKIPPGAAGGHEFERLMHQLLLRFADAQGFVYQPTSGAGGDDGIDGLAPKGGVPGLDGPVAFQFKWLWDDVHKGSKARQVRDSLDRAEARKAARHWILVTPRDLGGAERAWLRGLAHEGGMEIHDWGQERVESLLRAHAPFFARYYPHEARPLLDGYDGFEFISFASQYRESVARHHETIRTLGLPTKVKRERDAHAGIPLREIFVPLRFQAAGSDGDARSLASILAGGRSAVVLGDPGAGKSTLLAFLSLLYTGRATLAGFAPPDGKVPLFISLRDFARAQQAMPGLSFLEYLARYARSDLGLAHAHWAFFEWALRMGEAVVLIDGLDEVGRETARHRIARAVRAFRATFRECSFWITSRVYGYTRDVELPSAEFDELHIGRLDDEQVSTFVRRWYEIQVPNNPREREDLGDSLVHAVHRSGSVRRLAANPLLLTLMAFLHQSLGRLPKERGELYELCIDMLLRTWQEARRGEGPRSDPHPFENLGLHVATQKDYLAHVALYVQERNDAMEGEDARGLVGHGEALECLAKRHLSKSRRGRPSLELAEAREEMELFLDYLGDETGLLVNRGNDKLAFLHLSFQEYLAAWVFLCGSGGAEAGFFIKYLGSPAWEEVLLLRLYIVLRAPGGGGEEAFDRIVRALFERLGQMSFAPGWQMLARGVRDNLAFTPQDQETVLRKAVEHWAREGRFEGEWFGVLEEICLFAEGAKGALRGVLAGMAQRDEACARLQIRLFGTMEEQRAVEQAPQASMMEPPTGTDVIGTVLYATTPGEAEIVVASMNAAKQRVPEILFGARPGGALDIVRVGELLDGIEASMSVPDQPRSPLTVVGFGFIYAEAIWAAFDEPEWTELEMRAFADAVLNRAERFDAEDQVVLLETALGMLGVHAAWVQVPFVPPSPTDFDYLISQLPATKLWTYLRTWAGMDPRRRGVHARAVRQACREMHDRGGGNDVQCMPLLRGAAQQLVADPVSVLSGPEMQSLEILSATWQNRPLRKVAAELLSQQSKNKYPMNFEDMLCAGARSLAGQASNLIGDEQWWSYPYQLSGDELPFTAHAPPEALLLRAGPGAVSRTAPTLALLQGRHDGRAYDLLAKLAAHPETEEVKNAYARMTVLAPWRLVREDPSWIRTLRWAPGELGIFKTFPASLKDLREMLSEPADPLPPDRDLLSEVPGRLDKDGIWSRRSDYFDMMREACLVPGSLPLAFVAMQMRLEPKAYHQEVVYALLRLDHPDEMQGAQLAADIFFLRMAAAHKPFVKVAEGEVDLRERLPGLLVSVLKAVAKDPTPDTFAAAEAPILRLCARVIENLRGPDALVELDRLWLTYRLFQWLSLQLERMPKDARVLGLRALCEVSPPAPKIVPPDADLLDPARFDRARFDHRLGAVLYALTFMEDIAAVPPHAAKEHEQVPMTVSSQALEQHLAEIAARPLSEGERSLRHREEPSCLEWYAPTAIPDMALTALLRVNNEALLRITPDARLRMLQDLPRSPEDRTRLPWQIAGSLLVAATQYAKKLSVAERSAVEEALRALEGAPEALTLRWLALTRLYEAGGGHLEHEVVELLEKNLTEEPAPDALGSYLTALSRLAPDKLVPEAERILAAVEAAGLDPIPFASALAQPIVSGAPASVRPVKDCLRRLAARPPYRGDEKMMRLLGMLGVS